MATPTPITRTELATILGALTGGGKKPLRARLTCNTACLNRGQLVTVLRAEFDTFIIVRDEMSGIEHTLMPGDLELVTS